MSSNASKMTPVLGKVSTRWLCLHKNSIHVNFGQHGLWIVRNGYVRPVMRRNAGKGDDIENFLVIFLVVIPDNLPILHCEVVLIVFVVWMATDCVEYLVTTPAKNCPEKQKIWIMFLRAN